MAGGCYIDAHISMPDIVVSGSLIVKLVLFLLLALSVFSWAIILMKLARLREIRRENAVLMRIMDQDKPLDLVWQAAAKLGKSNHAAMVKEVCFFLDQKGFFQDKHPQPDAEFTYKDKMEADANRMSREFIDQEVIRLEENLTSLATIGNIAPFIGLFGTVWGIMNSFRGIAEAGSASLAAVAPGIAEALVATAVGLFAAIPAAAAYNYFLGAIRGQSASLQKYARQIDAVVKHKSWSVDASIPKAPEAMKT